MNNCQNDWRVNKIKEEKTQHRNHQALEFNLRSPNMNEVFSQEFYDSWLGDVHLVSDVVQKTKCYNFNHK